MILLRLCFVLILVTVFAHSDSAYALFEDEATFGSFYGRDWSSTIIWGGVGIVLAAVFGAATFFSGGALSPFAVPGVATIGTMIGNFMGVTGVAATKAGLALIGGGAIASGGLGMTGGAAILTTASGLVVEGGFIAGEVLHDSVKREKETEALYARLVTAGEGLLTFPLPTKNSGSDALKEAMKILGDIDNEVPLSFGDKLLVKKAITQILWDQEERDTALSALVHIDKNGPDASHKNQESMEDALNVLLQSIYVSKLRDAALLSLLYFILNDYKKAKNYADHAIEIASTEDPKSYKGRVTLPIFISATSSLYDTQVNHELSVSQLKDAILLEPNSKIIPVLFSIFLDRFTLHSMVDEKLNIGVFSEVFKIMKSPDLKEFRFTNYVLLLGRYLIHMEKESSKIKSLSDVSDDKVKNHPKILPYVQNALETYDLLLRGATDVESNIEVLSFDELKEEQKQAVAALRGESKRAVLDREKLSLLVAKLARN